MESNFETTSIFNGSVAQSLQLNDKNKFDDVLKQRFFYAPSSEIYGGIIYLVLGIAGLYDLGPAGAALEAQLVAAWRRHFIYKDSMLEIRSCQLTPYQTLKASGHVDRFTDVMVKDTVTGETFRCDHLIKSHLESQLNNSNLDENSQNQIAKIISSLDDMKIDDLKEIIKKYDIKSPTTKNSLTDPADFNLMFSTTIGCANAQAGPETAQGIFVNFKRLLESNNGRLPLVVAQIGVSFRNEISPRGGLLRCREFLMAEIEHFVHPDFKSHSQFHRIAALHVQLCPAGDGVNLPPIEMTLAEGVSRKLIANDLLAYYIGRTFQFLTSIGMDMSRVRFRQHLPNEMAHYACDCWDCEIQTYYGWVECVGLADRACYDLIQHSKFSGEKLVAQHNLPTPKIERTPTINLDKGVIGKAFRQESKTVISLLDSLKLDDVTKMDQDLSSQGTHQLLHGDNVYEINKNMIHSITYKDREVQTVDIYPHVIEPSFGIGRILYSLLCHTCMVRSTDTQRIWFDLPFFIAPIKCLVLPLSNKQEFRPFITSIIDQLASFEISHKIDDLNASIGKRYARGDEIGIPLAVTVDFDSIKSSPCTVTLRHRNTTQQVRIPLGIVGKTVSRLVRGKSSWGQIVENHGLFSSTK